MKTSNTRQSIIEVAAELFARNGVRRTTMEAIASAAGRGRRTVYMYFGDKTEIYNAVVTAETEHILKSLKEVLANDGDLCVVLHRYAFERYNGVSSLLKRNPLLFRDFVQSHNRIDRLRERLNNDEIKIVTPYFERVISEKPGMLTASSDILAVTFLNMLRGNDRIVTIKESHDEAMALITAACDIFLHGALR